MKRDTTIVAVPPERLQQRTVELCRCAIFASHADMIVQVERLILQRTVEQIEALLVRVVALGTQLGPHCGAVR